MQKFNGYTCEEYLVQYCYNPILYFTLILTISTINYQILTILYFLTILTIKSYSSKKFISTSHPVHIYPL